MCIAILNKASELSRESLQNCWTSNPAGAGILYAKNGELQIVKEMDSFDAYYASYLAVRQATDTPILLHFRIMTSGLVNLDNCHPFLIPGHPWGLVHNGMLDVQSDKTYSDTWHYANCYLPQYRDLTSEWTQHMIAETCGSYNKLLFLSNTGEWFIVNEQAGHWDAAADTWYSNDSYKSTKYSYHGSVRYERGTTYTPGSREFDWLDDDDDNTRSFDRALAEQDDDARYANKWLTDDSAELRRLIRQNADRAADRTMFAKELRVRSIHRDTPPYDSDELERRYQDFAIVDGLAPALVKAFDVSRQSRAEGVRTVFKSASTEQMYHAWNRYQNEQVPVAQPAAGATGTAKYSSDELRTFAVLRERYADFPAIDEPGFEKLRTAWWAKSHGLSTGDTPGKPHAGSAGGSATSYDGPSRDENVGCVDCGNTGLGYDEQEDAYWCHNCYDYVEDHKVFETGASVKQELPAAFD